MELNVSTSESPHGIRNPPNYLTSRAQPYVDPPLQGNEEMEMGSNALYGVFLGLGILAFLGLGIFALVRRVWRRPWTKSNSEDIGGFPPFGIKPLGLEVTVGGGLMISHSLPDLSRSVSQEQLIPTPEPKKVARQTTLPAVPQRHSSFQRQLSHRLDLDSVEFSVYSRPQRELNLGEIRPELYKGDVNRQDSEDNKTETETAGTISFTLKYDTEIDGLVVKVVQAHSLPVKDVTGSSDPYVKVYLLPDRKKKFCTKVHRRNLSPVFNETFVFNVTWNALADRTLQFSVYDFDRFSRNDLIGQVVVRRLMDYVQAGVELEYAMNILTSKQDTRDLGEVMLSLCYLPKAGRLTVTVIKMRNLRSLDLIGTSDPYVKVGVVCQGRRIKKKKTKIKKSTLNPVYNESLVFDVPNENVHDVTLVIKALDYDRVGANELMGVVVIGNGAIGQGRDHWFEMLESPRVPVAQWYPLQDCLPNTVPMTPISKVLPAPLSCLSR